MEQKDIAVSLQAGVLTIKGEKEAEKEDNDKRYHRVERSYGAFFRSMRLPAAVEGGKVTATFKERRGHPSRSPRRRSPRAPRSR